MQIYSLHFHIVWDSIHLYPFHRDGLFYLVCNCNVWIVYYISLGVTGYKFQIILAFCLKLKFLDYTGFLHGLKVFRIIPEFRILRLKASRKMLK